MRKGKVRYRVWCVDGPLFRSGCVCVCGGGGVVVGVMIS